jgi:Uma2 family endonuclease
MAVLITDRALADELTAQRRASGADRFDEVWEGLHIMTAVANDEHQQILTRFAGIFQTAIDWLGLGDVRAGVSVSDRADDWRHNYRIPDLAVFLPDTAAKNCGSHWQGGPDFAVEIISPDDRSRDKLPFYGQLGVRELLLIDRDPWVLELYQASDGRLVKKGQSTLEQPEVLASALLPFSFCLQPGDGRPLIEVTHTDGVQGWLV